MLAACDVVVGDDRRRSRYALAQCNFGLFRHYKAGCVVPALVVRLFLALKTDELLLRTVSCNRTCVHVSNKIMRVCSPAQIGFSDSHSYYQELFRWVLSVQPVSLACEYTGTNLVLSVQHSTIQYMFRIALNCVSVVFSYYWLRSHCE